MKTQEKHQYVLITFNDTEKHDILQISFCTDVEKCLLCSSLFISSLRISHYVK